MKKQIIVALFFVNLCFSTAIFAQSKEWIFIDPNTKDGFQGIHFINKNEGWAVGREIIFTKDGGNTWYRQFEGLKEKYTIFFRSIFFINQSNGWVVGD